MVWIPQASIAQKKETTCLFHSEIGNKLPNKQTNKQIRFQSVIPLSPWDQHIVIRVYIGLVCEPELVQNIFWQLAV